MTMDCLRMQIEIIIFVYGLVTKESFYLLKEKRRREGDRETERDGTSEKERRQRNKSILHYQPIKTITILFSKLYMKEKTKTNYKNVSYQDITENP